MPRYRLTIAYDGTDFHGWQKQRAPDAAPEPATDDPRPPDQVPAPEPGGLRTVQGVVERAVREVLREPVSILGASRTDSGVHARAQAAAFTSSPDPSRGVGWPLERGTDRLVRALNGRLPPDVLVTGAAVVDDAFNPIGACVAKGYSYRVHSSPVRPLWERRYVYHTWHALDDGAMREAAAGLVGEHDFASFAAAAHGRATTVRTVHACTVERESAERIRIDVSGNGFLYNMVRIIAGTLVEIGRGAKPPGSTGEILAARDRRAAGPTLPPEGLCLEWIRYPDGVLGEGGRA